MNESKTSCASTDQKWSTWESIDWNKCEIAVNKLQARIVKAQKAGKHGRVKALQWMLTHSFYAKALAVKTVLHRTEAVKLRVLIKLCGQLPTVNSRPSAS